MTGDCTPLPEEGSVGVIGAGPAGTFFALHLLRLLGEAGRKGRVTLIDRKVFERHGPAGCNMCAGAIGTAMVRKLEALGLPLDARVIRRIANGYEIHGRRVSVMVDSPDGGGIYTVFRGGGPVAPTGPAKSFDKFLLDAAVARGVEFVHDRVETIEQAGGSGFRVVLSGGGSRRFDFLVGAFGVNTTLAPKLRIGYEPPTTWHTVQAEIPADNVFITECLRNRIHIVPPTRPSVRFLAITPKDDVLTLTGIGEHVRIADLEGERTGNPVLRSLLPEESRILCHCHPQVPVGVAKRPFGDRIAIVGDAFISRYLKNGIESSHDTARILAEAMVGGGISGMSLRDNFYRPCMARFRYDNVWGRGLFGIYEDILRKGRLSDIYLAAADREKTAGRGFQARILWSVFAGDAPYREIAFDALSPAAVLGLLKSLRAGGAK